MFFPPLESLRALEPFPLRPVCVTRRYFPCYERPELNCQQSLPFELVRRFLPEAYKGWRLNRLHRGTGWGVGFGGWWYLLVWWGRKGRGTGKKIWWTFYAERVCVESGGSFEIRTKWGFRKIRQQKMKQLEGVIYPTLRSKSRDSILFGSLRKNLLWHEINGSAGTPQMLCETSTTWRLQVGTVSQVQTPPKFRKPQKFLVDDQITFKRVAKTPVKTVGFCLNQFILCSGNPTNQGRTQKIFQLPKFLDSVVGVGFLRFFFGRS